MPENVKIAADWKNELAKEFSKPYFEKLVEFVKREYQSQKVYPSGSNIFRAFDQTPYEKVKVVILGQDPYHGPGQANGLCFSVNKGLPFPPSLRNIFKELNDDLAKPIPPDGDLSHWAKQGVLLLNATLTVQAYKAGSHQGKGWEEFTDSVIQNLNENRSGIVYMLWGSYAQKKAAFVKADRNLILKSPHPSPLSAHRGFFGNRHFSKANEYLKKLGKEPINW
jgi:uracil-DNA glycosylase